MNASIVELLAALISLGVIVNLCLTARRRKPRRSATAGLPHADAQAPVATRLLPAQPRPFAEPPTHHRSSSHADDLVAFTQQLAELEAAAMAELDRLEQRAQARRGQR